MPLHRLTLVGYEWSAVVNFEYCHGYSGVLPQQLDRQ
jgi:hypothetical protein